MNRTKNTRIKSLYIVMMFVIVTFAVTRFSTIISLADGSGVAGDPYTTMEETVKAVRRGLMARESTITVHSVLPAEYTSDPNSYLGDVYNAALVHDPSCPNGGDYLESNRGAMTASLGGYTTDLTMTYNTPECGQPKGYLDTPEQEVKTLQALDAAVTSLSLDGKTDYEKVKAIYDYVRLNVTYDHSLTDHSTYSAAVLRKSVCQGYASMLYYMMLKAGIDCRIITGNVYDADGNPEGHAWNIVKITDATYGTKWYNVDVTWDSDNGSDSWFLMSDASFDPRDGDNPIANVSHVRDSKFKTDDFLEKYPVSAVDNPFKGIEGVKLLGCSAIVTDSIYVEYWFATLPNSVSTDESMRVEFTFPRNNSAYSYELTYAQKEPGKHWSGEQECDVFRCRIPASAMSDAVCAQVTTSSGSSELYRVSFKKYADVLLEWDAHNIQTLGNYNRNILLSMLKYGGCAQRYFNVNPSVYADEGIDVSSIERNINTSGALPFSQKPTSSDSKIEYYASCLMLREHIILRHYFLVDDSVQPDDYVFSRNSNVFTAKRSGNYLIVDVTDLGGVKDLDIAPCNLHVKRKGESSDVLSVNYNPMNYIKIADTKYNTPGNTDVSDSLYALLKALYNYHYYSEADY